VQNQYFQEGKRRTTRFLKKFPKNIIKKAIKDGIRTIEAMDVNFAGVDVMISKDFKIYVIELNAFPGFPKESKFNLSKRIMQQMEGKKWN